MLKTQTKEAILELQKRYPEKRSALIPALHLAQEEVGYLPPLIQLEVAELFGIDPNEVRAVVSFYDMFFEEPVGKQLFRVCKNLSCMLLGADQLLERFSEKWGICPGQTSGDGACTLLAVECLGACDRAPAMLLNQELMGPVGAIELDAAALKSGLKPKDEASNG